MEVLQQRGWQTLTAGEWTPRAGQRSGLCGRIQLRWCVQAPCSWSTATADKQRAAGESLTTSWSLGWHDADVDVSSIVLWMCLTGCRSGGIHHCGSPSGSIQPIDVIVIYRTGIIWCVCVCVCVCCALIQSHISASTYRLDEPTQTIDLCR